MCLAVEKDSKPIKSDKDIVCYKICIQNSNAIYSPFYSYKYEIGKEYNNIVIDKEPKCRFRFYYISSGFHSFAYLDDCIAYLKHFSYWVDLEPNFKYVILKCIIPNGSLFYTGTFSVKDADCKSYASKQLKILEYVRIS